MSALFDRFRARRTDEAQQAAVKNGQLTFRRFDGAKDGSLYNLWRRDAWRCAHNTELGYEDVYLKYAAVRAKYDPDAVSVALFDGTPCGILELDTKRNAAKGSGWISFFYLTEEYRGKGFGRQLMQEAERIYKSKGRRSVSLCAAEDNLRALGFYRHLGFVKTGEEMGALGPLFIFEKDINDGR